MLRIKITGWKQGPLSSRRKENASIWFRDSLSARSLIIIMLRRKSCFYKLETGSNSLTHGVSSMIFRQMGNCHHKTWISPSICHFQSPLIRQRSSQCRRVGDKCCPLNAPSLEQEGLAIHILLRAHLLDTIFFSSTFLVSW
jgi:hypothetical protein